MFLLRRWRSFVSRARRRRCSLVIILGAFLIFWLYTVFNSDSLLPFPFSINVLPLPAPPSNQQSIQQQSKNNLVPMIENVVEPYTGPQIVVSTPKSVTNRVAILIVDDEFEDAVPLILSAKDYLQLNSTFSYPPPGGSTPAAVYNLARTITYFLFAAAWKKYTQVLPQDVIRINVDDDELILEGLKNPCKVYAKYADGFGYFSQDKFDHVLSFDNRMKIIGPIDLHNELLGQRVAVLHPTFYSIFNHQLHPYYRDDSVPCANVSFGAEGQQYFAGNLFGGEASEFADLCRTIAYCSSEVSTGKDDPPPQFHQMINRYFVDNKPSRVLAPSYLYAASIKELPFFPKKIQFFDEDREHLPPLMDDTSFFNKREERVQKLVQLLRQNYFNRMTQTFTQPQGVRPQFIAFRCDLTGGCGGFGGHMRGMAALLYLAIVSGRIYNVQWVDPADLGNFFALNEAWYGVTSRQFDAQLMPASYRSFYLFGNSNIDSGDTRQLATIFSTWQYMRLRMKADVLLVSTNFGKKLLQPIFSLPLFYPALFENIPQMLPEYLTNAEYSVFLSAALRISLGNQKETLKKLLNETIISLTDSGTWADSTKIGIQLRTCQQHQGKMCSPLTEQHWKCFAEKAVEIITTLKLEKALVVVTSDLNDSVPIADAIRPHLPLSLPVKVVATTSHRRGAGSSGWQQMASMTVDWMLLTKMDWLVISRSDFGETASLYSLKPTYRFEGIQSSSCAFASYNIDLSSTDDET